jgi:NADH dehydrogenase (ubiquinone) 1 alpha/beta subcomplex 1
LTVVKNFDKVDPDKVRNSKRNGRDHARRGSKEVALHSIFTRYRIDFFQVTPESKFADDLGLDSLDAVEVVMAIEDEFAIEIPDAEADKIASVGDAVEYITSHPMAK